MKSFIDDDVFSTFVVFMIMSDDDHDDDHEHVAAINHVGPT